MVLMISLIWILRRHRNNMEKQEKCVFFMVNMQEKCIFAVAIL